MKKISLLLVLLAVSFSFAQNQRFIYNYNFTLDVSKKDTLDSELMYLDVNKDGSHFYSRSRFVFDSILTNQVQKNTQSMSMNVSINMKGMTRGKIGWSVSKTYPEYKIVFKDNMGTDRYNVSDSRKMEWKILPEKEQVGEFNAQKATTTFAGRNWTAWFTPEIPIQDGPYKFHGLPGLIVKMEDESHTHNFVLTAVQNNVVPAEQAESPLSSFRQSISLNQNQYKKAFLENRNDPAKSMRTMMGSATVVRMTDQNGKEVDMNQMIRQREARQKAINEKETNLLEADLLQ